MSRKPLPGFGVKGTMGKRGALVRAFIETLGTGATTRRRIIVQESVKGARQYETWPDTPQNREYAKAYAEERARILALPAGAVVAPRPALTLRALWDAYRTARFDELKLTTQRNYTEAWDALELFAGRDHLAPQVTRELLDRWRKELRRAPIKTGKPKSTGQIRRMVTTVLQVFRWAMIERDLLDPSKILDYRVKTPKRDRPERVPEYTREEVQKLLAYFDAKGPRDSRRWRPWVLSYVLAFAGPRQTAARSLEWRDIDFGAPVVNRKTGQLRFPRARLHFRAELDKMGEDRWQPIPQPVVDALWVAYGWRVMSGYDGPYVFFRPGRAPLTLDPRKGRGGRWYPTARAAAARARTPDLPWTYSAFHKALTKAETATKVEHHDQRAAHSYRRHVISELVKRTGGNLVLAGQYVGDRDLKTLQESYVREREDELRAAGDLLVDWEAPTSPGEPTDAKEDQP